MNPNPLDYDVYHLGVSGGKDSTAVLLWLVYESGWPTSRIRATFCDTGNEDPLTYHFLAVLSERVHPIQYLFPDRDFWELARWKKRFPSRKARFCTQFLKIIPTRNHVRELTRDGRRVLMLNGIRAEEDHAGNNRGTVPQFGFDDGFACDVFRPALHWSLQDVWERHRRWLHVEDILTIIEIDPSLDPRHKELLSRRVRRHGIPRNPLYETGARRVGCWPCVNSAKREVRAVAKFRPDKIDFIAGQEGQFTDNPNMISTFFPRKTVPARHRSRPIVTAGSEKMHVATIHDVVRWSRTAWGARQYSMDLELAPASACDIGGFCE